MHEEKNAPINEGQEYEVEIESVGAKGDGIAKIKGFVIFVAGTKKGEYVKIKVKKVLQNAAFAEVVKKLEKPERPVRRQKFATVTQEEAEEEPVYSKDYEETEDFGEDLEIDE